MLRNAMVHLRHLGRGRGDEGGQALIFVLIAVAMLATIPVALATTTVGQLPQTTYNLNYEAAYEAAQAGLNDYMQHLDANEAFGLYCKTCVNGTGSDTAFSSWVQASTSPLEYYTYAPTDTSGVISLEVSGQAGTGDEEVVRTFRYSIRPSTSLDYVYWSNFESLDPTIAALESNPPSNYQYCGTHYDEPSSDNYSGVSGIPANGPPSGCPVVFTTGDVLNGPVFSNDTFQMCGSPTIDSSLQSGNIYNSASGSAGIYVAGSGCTSTPTFNGPAASKVSNQPPRTASDDLIPARDYGCFITGGTAPSSLTPVNVTMTLSVSSSTTSVAWSGTSGSPVVDNASTNHNSCTSPINVSNLTSGLIFVNGNVTISGTMTGGLDVVTCSTTNDASTTTLAASSCKGSTQSNIVIPASLTYPSANKVMVSSEPTSDANDALGLIAQNNVEVTTTSSVEIDAAILALSDSFYVNNWFGGSSYGTLTLFGSITQNYRGPVGLTSGSGYLKNYNYDSSLQTLFPPFFIPPNGATWAPTTYEECLPGVSHSVQSTPSC